MGILSDDPTSEASRQWTERVARFRLDLEASLSALATPLDLPVPAAVSDDARPYDALRDILEAASTGGQREILRAVLEGSELCFRRTVLFIGRIEDLVAWERRGFGGGPERGHPAEPIRLSAGGTHLPGRARTGGALVVAGPEGPGDDVVQALGGRVPVSSAAAPLLVRTRAVAVLYGDAPDAAPAGRRGLFDLLARVGGLALELRASRLRLAAAAQSGALLPAPSGNRFVRQGGFDANPAAPEEAEMQALLGDIEMLPRREEGDDLSPEEQRQHNDARRFASLLVSELLLYNEEAVIQGRKQRDLSRRLAPEIERTRRAYEARIPSGLRGGPRYLEDELLRVLADGDEALLAV